jgi:hypothetical protein
LSSKAASAKNVFCEDFINFEPVFKNNSADFPEAAPI